MTKKEAFINMVEELLKPIDVQELSEEDDENKMALEYFAELKNDKPKEKVELTENGAKILKYMQESADSNNNSFTSKSIGEGLFISSRSAAGAMRKLVSEGFVKKNAGEPATYSITNKGKEKLI
jgi:predicted transcriptional regulator